MLSKLFYIIMTGKSTKKLIFMAIIIPLACVSCGWRIDVRSDDPDGMPIQCALCHNKLKPAGAITQDKTKGSDPFYTGKISWRDD